MPVYNKLVRDKILEVIEAKGLQYNAKMLDSNDFILEVKAKMKEEAQEFYEANNVNDSLEELADILELVHTAVNLLGVSYEELNVIREQKKAKRGGFEKAIYLMDVTDQ
jgi:predicted house-cleaning noncanonical NTP pyrophosphatase (MazG superfamily)